MSPTLIRPLIKDVILELLKSTQKRSNLEQILKIIVSSKEGLQAFLELLNEQIQSISFNTRLTPAVIITLKHGEIKTDIFPLNLWKLVVPIIPCLNIHYLDDNIHKPLMEAIQQYGRLNKVNICSNVYSSVKTAACCYLLNTFVKSLRAHTSWISRINSLESGNIKNAEEVEIIEKYTRAGRRLNVFKNLMSNFQVPCKSLKVEWNDSVCDFIIIISSTGKAVISNTVQQLQFTAEIDELEIMEDPVLKELLETSQKAFPNLKSAKVFLTSSVQIGNQLNRLGAFVQQLKDQIKNAKINFNLDFHFESDFYNENDGDLEAITNNLIKNSFVMTKSTNQNQLWIHNDKVAENKIIKLEYHLCC